MFDAPAALNAALAFAAGATGFTLVMGTPESLSTRAGGYVALGAAQPRDVAAGGLIERPVDCHVVLGYRVAGAEAAAELSIAAAVDALTLAFYATDRGLGVGESAELDFGLVGSAEYDRIAGQEYRLYPIVVRVIQRHSMAV